MNDDKPVKRFINGILIKKEHIAAGKFVVKQEKTRLTLIINDLIMSEHNEATITGQVGDNAKCKRTTSSLLSNWSIWVLKKTT